MAVDPLIKKEKIVKIAPTPILTTIVPTPIPTTSATTPSQYAPGATNVQNKPIAPPDAFNPGGKNKVLPTSVSYNGLNGARGSITVKPGDENIPWTNGVEQGDGSRNTARQALSQPSSVQQISQPIKNGSPSIGQHYSIPESDGTIGGNIVQRRTAAMMNAFNKTNNDADQNSITIRGQDIGANDSVQKNSLTARGQDMTYGLQAEQNQVTADHYKAQGLQSQSVADKNKADLDLLSRAGDPKATSAERAIALQALGHGPAVPRPDVLPAVPGLPGSPGTPAMVVDPTTATYRPVTPAPTEIPTHATPLDKLNSLKGTPQYEEALREYTTRFGAPKGN